jgi:hypothetical protein
MPMQPPAQKYAILAFGILALMIVTGCGKKGRIEYETAQSKIILNEQAAALKKVLADSAAVGDLGYYNAPQAGHLEQLRSKVKSLSAETQELKAERDRLRKDIELLQQDMDSYRTRYLH